ncbi:MAG: flagellar hook protein [Hyphomicrobiales bacterium]|nr:flagellar hook protein [Hyphomicrobiales bacterium]
MGQVMKDVVLSAGVRQNLLSLQSTAQLMSTTQYRLATGKKVNTALDNPVNYFTAAGLQSRASDLGALADSMANGIKTLQAADNGLTSITTMLQSMKSTLLQARQDKSFKSQGYGLGTINTASMQYLTFSGGSIGSTPVQVALTTNVGGTPVPATGAVYDAGAFSNVNLTGTSASAAVVNGGAFSAVDFTNAGANNGQITLNLSIDGGATTPVTIGYLDVHGVAANDAAVTGAELAGIINTKYGSSVASFSAGALHFTSPTTGTGSTVAITGFSATNGATGSGIANGSATGQAAAAASITFTLTVDGTSRNIALNNTITAVNMAAVTGTEIATAINNQFGANVATFSAGALHITSPTTGLGSNVTIANFAVAAGAIGSGLANTSISGTAAGVTGGANTAKTIDEIINDINASAALKNRVRASNDGGKIRIQNLATGDLTVTGVDVNGNVDGGTGVSTVEGNLVRANLATQYNEQRDQLDKLATDSSFNGVNLLNGDQLKVVFNETGSNILAIQAKDQSGNPFTVNATNLGVSFLKSSDLDFDASIDTLLDQVAQALNVARSQASSFGSYLSIVENRQDFTKNMINTLKTGADNLVLADTNEEGANLLALQTRQQLSTTALSLAAQADQAVLRLFG